ncbi:MAG: protein translocase subunit SecF [Syntrophomonadaceae bacterium]|nr:protein translocase subunit SecF [Syntrophomonadaceae bacterium]
MKQKKKNLNAKTAADSAGRAAANTVVETTSPPTTGEPGRIIDFIGRRKIWYLISLLIVIPGLISLALQGLNLGIDFSGGNLMQLKFNNPAVEIVQVRQALGEFGLEKAPVIQTTADGEFLIRTEELTEERSEQLLNTLQQQLGGLEVLRNEKVGAVFGSELRRNALLALGIAALLMLVYITFRFEFRFGLAAVIALLHDALVVVGVFSLLRLEVDVSFVAAILTILGYSINDTIVIFDRIRENRKNYPKMDLVEMVNRSITQTLTRSINTVLTVVFCLVALLAFGGSTTRIFVLAMLIGVVSGCYSSICNASPLWVDFTGIGGKKGGRRAFAGAR